MRHHGLRKEFRHNHTDAEEKDLPKALEGEVKAFYCPNDDIDWLLGENKAYQRVVFLDSQGYVTYTYMEAKWVPTHNEHRDREQFAYLLCTHLTLPLFCIGPNCWDHIWSWGPSDESELSVEDKKSHTGVWAVVTNDWQHNMFGVLRTWLFRPERTWGNCEKSPGNTGTKGNITAYHGYLHMNAYPVFLTPRLKAASSEQEEKKDNGKILDTGIKGIFGGDLVPEFCFGTSKLNTGMQYSEGQEVTIHAHNQQATYPVRYTDEQKVMGFANHMGGVRWKILAIMWCNLISKDAGEPVFLLWSEHITEWANYESTQETLVDAYVTYPRWRFVPESGIKAIMTGRIVALSESEKIIKNLALRGTEPDPKDPKAPEILEQQKKARGESKEGT